MQTSFRQAGLHSINLPLFRSSLLSLSPPIVSLSARISAVAMRPSIFSKAITLSMKVFLGRQIWSFPLHSRMFIK